MRRWGFGAGEKGGFSLFAPAGFHRLGEKVLDLGVDGAEVLLGQRRHRVVQAGPQAQKDLLFGLFPLFEGLFPAEDLRLHRRHTLQTRLELPLFLVRAHGQ